MQLAAMLLASGHDPDQQNNDGISARALSEKGNLIAISTLIQASESPLEPPDYTRLATFERMRDATEI